MGKPTVLHTEDSSGRLCGLERTDSQSWPDKYLNDEFAQTLPPCPKCLSEIIMRGWKVPKMWESSQPIDDLFADTPVYVEEDDEIFYSSSDEEMSLREWCE